jgi:hypothetical protein
METWNVWETSGSEETVERGEMYVIKRESIVLDTPF